MTSRTVLRLTTASTYQTYHSMQDRDGSMVLRQFKSKMRPKNRSKILDVGCGPGDFTANYLLPLLPNNGEMLAVDVSPAMIQYANETCKDPRLNFMVGDIADPNFGAKYKRVFGAVLSFYCLHWVQNQRAAMKNIYDILRPDGETLLVFLASCPLYLLYEIISKRNKWAPYMKDYKEAISPYYFCENPERDVRDLLTDIGFDIQDCFCTPMSYTMPTRDLLYKSVEAVNPFLTRIPEHLQEEYNEECKSEIFGNRKLTILSDETDEVSYSYTLIIVHAVKPDPTA